MNQDQVKELLEKIRPNTPEFVVIYTGKASRKVNGLYKPESREILLHNMNFTSDQELVYTAVHEFAHHVHFCSEAPPAGPRSHTKAFWLIFHGLLGEAIERGLYCPPMDQDLSAAVARVKTSLKAEGEALKETGRTLLALVQECKRSHVRFEDYLDRVVGISRRSAETAMAAYAQDVRTEEGPDMVRLSVKIKDPEIRRLVSVTPGTLVEKQAAASGQVAPAPAVPGTIPMQSKDRMRKNLEARLCRLEEEAEAIRTKIQTLDEEDAPRMSQSADRQLSWRF